MARVDHAADLSAVGAEGADEDHGREREVTLLEVAPAKARAFRDWNMTERRLTALQGPILARFGQEEAFDPAKLTGKQAFELLSALGIAYAA